MKLVNDCSKSLYELSLAATRLAAGDGFRVSVRRDGRTDTFFHEIFFSVEFGKLIFAHWGDGAAGSWRVTAFEVRDGFIRLAVSRCAGRDTADVTISAPDSPFIAFAGTPVEQRRDFAGMLRRLTVQAVAGAKTGPVGQSDSESRFRPRPVLSCRFRFGDARGLAIGLAPEEPSSVVDLFLDETARAAAREWERVVAFVPEPLAGRIAERLAFARPLKVAFFAYDGEFRIRPLAPAAQGELAAEPLRSRWLPPPVVLTAGESAVLDEAFGTWRQVPDIVPAVGRKTLSIQWNGLECARLRRETAGHAPVLSFGLATLGEPVRLLNFKNRPQFLEMIDLLSRHRVAGARDRTHALHRARPERWLEAVIARRLSALDTELDDRFAYRQVPALGRSESGIADILGLTRAAAPAVIELKAAADGGLFWQGLEYWRRVVAHHRRGELARRGYFPDIALCGVPRLYLVAPALRFHAAFRHACRSARPDVPVRVVAIGERWREELRVISTEDFGGLQETAARP